MPALIIVTELEADALRAAGVDGLEGACFTYEPTKTMEIINKVQKAAHEGAERITGRLAEILGRHFSGAMGGPASNEAIVPEILRSEYVVPKRKRGTPSPAPEPVLDPSADQ